jgi:3-dehydroquinate synthase
MQKLKLKTATHHYPILVGSQILQNIGSEMKKLGLKGTIGIVTVKKVHDLYGDILRDSLQKEGFLTRTIFIPDGEATKTFATIEQILTAFIQQGLDRSSILLGFGGGVVGDMCGFAASILFRGVKFVLAPTTLLSQVDASVGGKTGVNHVAGKNLIGTFYQPELVLIDTSMIKSLESRDIIAGFAEMIKTGLVKDATYFSTLIAHQSEILALDEEILSKAIYTSCQLKARVVEEDEREIGLRKILNFGHTFGHAIESVAGFGTLRHGEAVLLGMLAATLLSHHLGFLESNAYSTIKEALLHIPLETKIPKMDIDTLIKAMLHDKKRVNQETQFVLLDKIGHAFVHSGIDEKEIKIAFKETLSTFTKMGL